MKKRIIEFGVLMVLLLSLAACGKKEEIKDVEKSEQTIAGEGFETEKAETPDITEDDSAATESSDATKGAEEESDPSDDIYLEEIDREKYPYLLSWKGESDGKLLSRYYFFKEDLSVVYKVAIDRKRVGEGQGFSYETSAEKMPMKLAEEKRDSVMALICDASGAAAAETVSDAMKDPMNDILQ